MPILQAKNLVKFYKTRKVVRDVSLHLKAGEKGINAGEIVGLLGPNGAGKTTCFYMLVGLIGCDEGSVFLDEQDITLKPIHARARLGIGYLPQEVSVFRKLTVEKNILAILELRKELNKIQRQERLEALITEFNLGHVRKNVAYSLSGGERRRVEIARALAIEPKFILLDEPFAGIDPISVVDIKRIITHLSKERGIGVLITDHNVRETLAICERAYILNDGQLIAEGEPKLLLQNQQVREVYLGEEFYI